MTSHILVPLRSSDRIEHVLPYVERIVRPGMKVIFLVHYAMRSFEKFLDLLLAINTEIRPEFLPQSRSAEYSKEECRLSAHNKIAAGCESLVRLGAEIEVGVYTGRLKKAVREGWFFYYQDGPYQIVYHGTEGKAFSHAQARKIMVAKFLIIFVALLLSVPYWRALGFIH